MDDNVEKDFQASKQLGMRSVYFNNADVLYLVSEVKEIQGITEIKNMI